MNILRSRRTAVVALATAAVLPATVLSATAASAASPCQYGGCFTNTSTASSARGASVWAWTNAPTTASVNILNSGNATVAKASDPAFATHHQLDVTGLQPGQTYGYLMTVTDKAGHSALRYGTFTQKNVQIKVRFTQIAMSDDSDVFGKGELTLYLRGANKTLGPVFSNRSTGDHDIIWLDDTTTTVDNADSVPLGAEMVDEDCGFCTYGLGADWGSGRDSQHDWATATTWISTAKPTEAPVAFQATVAGPVGFRVSGSVDVEFV